ncbi:uncharacterized protein LOC132742488 [Ruditapes philippinarum]|uniref:uncharacterized protein LOC132742488 n=1 Tax=Ruditapes philippinarum TaxID=129788 RepID=UPI00295BF092|nr:uncharacterized protein LOC132742488 [Ruditapes philippinarum]
MINSYQRQSFKSVCVTIANTSTKSKQFSLFCRKIIVNKSTQAIVAKCGVMTYLKEDMELISDIYEYLVNQNVEEVGITVPVYTTCSRFDTVYIIDSTGSMFKCSDISEVDKVIYYSSCMNLRAYENNIYSFAVVMETKYDTFTVTGMAETLTSSVENEFKVQLPNTCLPKNTRLSLKVIPTEEYQSTLNSELIKSTSNFCEVKINQKNRRALAISLPVPRGVEESTAEDTDVTVFHYDEETQTPSEWREVESVWRPGSSHVTVTDTSISSGTCIVTEVRKNREINVLSRIKEFVMWLYNTALKRKAYVCFFAMTKHCSGETFRLLVGLSDTKIANDHMKTLEKEKYVTEFSQKTSNYLVKPGTRFCACWKFNSESAVSSEELSLTYHRDTPSYQDFIISGKEHDFLQVTISVCNNKISVGNDIETRILTKINVELLLQRNDNKKHGSSLEFTEYPDNRFLSWLAQEIGHEWMMIGIGLGLKSSYLESIERDNSPTRANLTMLYTWRIDQNEKDDIGLTVLLQSLTLVQRKDLVAKINSDVQDLLTRKPNERVCRWVRKLSTPADVMKAEAADVTSADADEELDDVDGVTPITDTASVCKDSHSDRLCISCLTEPEQASPLSELFLVHIASVVGSDSQLILQLGLPQSVTDEIRHTIREPVSAMFKCLLLAQRRYSDSVDFFKDLLEGLTVQGKIHPKTEIKELCRKWFKINSSYKNNRQLQKLEHVLDTY